MYHFIVNSRSKRTQKALKKIGKFMRGRKLPFEIHDTFYPGSAIKIARKLSEEGAGEIIAVGGDGTFNEVINGIDLKKTAVGFIAAGSGNDFARASGLSLKPVRAMLDILRGEVAEIDCLEVGGDKIRRCLNVAGTGIDVDVLTLFNKKRAKGKLQYYLCLFRALRHFKPYRLKLTLPDGTEKESDAFMVAACNGRYIGGGMKISPNSRLRDGLMDVVLIEMTDRKTVTRNIFKFFKGKHIGKPFVKVYSVKSVKIENERKGPLNIDGELIPGLPLNVKVLSRALRIYAPADNKRGDSAMR